MSEVVLYGRPGCHLCDEARALIDRLVAEGATGFSLREINIESDDSLLLRYLERIPVIEVNGAIVSELVPDFQALQTALLHNCPR